jgi:acetylornithine deacetylase
LETPCEEEVVQTVKQSAEAILNAPCPSTGVSYWTDASSLWSAGIPTVLFGPIGAGAHAAKEWVDLASVQACADIYLATAMAFCS